MKTILLTLLRQGILISVIAFSSLTSYSQLSNGGFHAKFGVDADTRAGYLKFGPTTGSVASDDWFAGNTGTSRSVIDTANATALRTALQGGQNLSFSKGMSVPLYSKINSTTWLDATYARDHVVLPLVDSTAFLIVASNGDDPSAWTGGTSSVPDKNDILDVFAHMRRNGLNITDSLWFFTAVSTTGTLGDRYFDVELFKNKLGYDKTTGAFGSGGPDMGHTSWKFDASGNITQTGDLIIAITYSPGAAPVIDVRLWVARTTFNTVVPTRFNFGSSFNGKTFAAAYGYGTIVSKSGGTVFGSGTGNYSATGTDTTYSAPWGTTNLVTGTTSWSANYQSLQLVEMGINLTRIGIDPALYSALGTSPCESLFQSILYKTRTASAFNANLSDFVGPLDFMKNPTLDHTVKNDTLSCSKTLGTLRVNSNTTAGFYQWKTPAGATVSGSTLAINKTGTYILEASVAGGCPVTRRDTLKVIADSLAPVATASAGVTPDLLRIQLYGGDTAASKVMTPFGGSKGLTWSWTGPAGYTATTQNPLADTNGTYTVTVTELRNGCKKSASTVVSLVLLHDAKITLTSKLLTHAAKLVWNKPASAATNSFEIERSTSGNVFTRISNISGNDINGSGSEISYHDVNMAAGKNYYRVAYQAVSGNKIYSNTVVVTNNKEKMNIRLLTPADPANWYLKADLKDAGNANLVILDNTGNLISRQHINFQKGENNIPVSKQVTTNGNVYVLVLYFGNEVVFSQLVTR